MMSIRAATAETVDDDWLLLSVFGLLAIEGIVRVGIARITNPFAILLLPPVVAVVGLGVLVPRLEDTPAQGGRLLAKLAVVAVLGHALALVIGAMLFFLVDTPIRWLAYAMGFDPLESQLLALGVPLWGVGAGTVVVWTVPALVAASLVQSSNHPVGDALQMLTAEPRTVATLAGLHLVVVLLGALGAGFGYVTGLKTDSLLLFIGIGTLGAVLLMVVPVAVAVTVHLSTMERQSGEAEFAEFGSLLRTQSVTSLLLVVVLVVGLGTLAGTVRVDEQRPTQSPDSLGEDPNAAYETAVDNTFGGSYRVVWINSPGTENETRVYDARYDHETREHKIVSDTVDYISPVTIAAEPGFFSGAPKHEPLLREAVLSEQEGDTFIRQSPGVHPALTDHFAKDSIDEIGEFVTWEPVEDGDEIVLESTDPAEIMAFETNDENVNVTESDTAWIRATIDAETKTLSRIEYRFEGQLEDFEEPYDSHFAWEFETGTDVERPDELDVTLEERVWNLLIY